MTTTEQTRYPWGSGIPDPNTVYLIKISDILVPDTRVTSTFNPEQKEELLQSLKTEGQKDPVKLLYVNSQLVLADGLNRILGLKQLSVETVKALIVPGSLSDVQIANIITARHRGKENPAQTAEVITDLIEHEKMTPGEVKTRLGLKDHTFRTLYRISTLPPEIKDLIKYGKLGVGAAYHLAQLTDKAQAITLANQAVSWVYTEEQVKLAVIQILNPNIDSSQLPVVFNPDGRPVIHYPKCTGCNVELQSVIFPLNCCQDCYEAAKAFFSQYFAPGNVIPESEITERTNVSPNTGFVQE